jgi:TetR/AcrR family transcriptional regulator, transcriptional repressor of aconitase
VVVEQSRRRRTDPTFRDRWTRRTTLVRNALRTLVHHERAAGRITPTVPDEVAARFISVVGDGLLSRARFGSGARPRPGARARLTPTRRGRAPRGGA